MRRAHALIVSIVGMASLAHAQASPAVAWRAPASCGREGFDAELRRLRVPSDARALEVTLTQRASSWETTVSIAHATRTLQLASCAEAQRAAALLIATALAPAHAPPTPEPRAPDVPTAGKERARSRRPRTAAPSAPSNPPDAEAAGSPVTPPPDREAPDSPPVPLAPTESAAPPGPETPRAAAPAEAKRTPGRRQRAEGAGRSDLALRLGGWLASGTLPRASAGPSAGIELARARLAMWVDARYLIARRAADTNSSLRADLDLFALAAGAAWLWPAGPLAFGPMLELEGGVLRARGQGEANATNVRLPWLAASLGARVDAHLSRRVAVGLYAAASLPFWRPGVQLADESPFHTTSPIAFRLGIVVRLALGSTKAPGDGQ